MAHLSQAEDNFYCTIEHVCPSFCVITINLRAPCVQTLYRHACVLQQKKITIPGFEAGNVPLAYIESNFETTILVHLKELLFQFFVVSFLYNQIRTKKLTIAGEPRLKQINLQQNTDAQFLFEVSIVPDLALKEWKYFPFKCPKRKKYKDLDRQVKNFIEEELLQLNNYQNTSIAIGDWVNFTVTIVNNITREPFFQELTQNLWIKLGSEEADGVLNEIFLGKELNDSFLIKSQGIQHCFSEYLDTNYTFLITINDVLPHAYFCFDDFKHHFKLKTNKAITQKLIEIFSFSNDISQRRLIAEGALKLLLDKQPFTIPHFLVLRQEKKIIDKIKKNPDYNVYRMQKDFKKSIEQLATKMAKETILLDQIAYRNNIAVTHKDVRAYLNLIKRTRTKDFIYFDPIETKLKEQEVPITAEELAIVCLREKTLNYIIHQLTD